MNPFVYKPPHVDMPPIPITYGIKFGGSISEERQNYLRNDYLSAGWKIDRDDEEELSFSLLEDQEHEWISIYYKKTGGNHRFNGKQIINLQIKPETTNDINN